MATNKQTITIPKITGEDDTVECCINGTNYIIKRGEKVEVPTELIELLKECGVI